MCCCDDDTDCGTSAGWLQRKPYQRDWETSMHFTDKDFLFNRLYCKGKVKQVNNGCHCYGISREEG